MKNRKKVSVIVPCFNAKKYIAKCMDYLFRQTIGLENIEIILIDDASTDDGKTLNALLQYEALYPEHIVVIPLQENRRQGGARNIGMQYATGEYIAFCDADDWFAEGALERLYDIAKQYDCDVVEFENQDIKENEQEEKAAGEKTGQDEFRTIETVEERKQYLLSSRSTQGCCMKMYRTSMVLDNQLMFAEHVAWEEPSFIYLVRLYEKRHYFLEEVWKYTYLSPDSTMRSSYAEKKYDNMITFQTLLGEIERRNLFETYKEEWEIIFFKYYFHRSLWQAAAVNTFFPRNTFMEMQEVMRRIAPDIKNNKYFKEEFADVPGIADMVYLDASRADMQKLQKIYKDIYEIMYKEWMEGEEE